MSSFAGPGSPTNNMKKILLAAAALLALYGSAHGAPQLSAQDLGSVGVASEVQYSSGTSANNGPSSFSLIIQSSVTYRWDLNIKITSGSLNASDMAQCQVGQVGGALDATAGRYLTEILNYSNGYNVNQAASVAHWTLWTGAGGAASGTGDMFNFTGTIRSYLGRNDGFSVTGTAFQTSEGFSSGTFGTDQAVYAYFTQGGPKFPFQITCWAEPGFGFQWESILYQVGK